MSELRVYKLLPKIYAMKDLREQRIKVSEISELNDPFEFLPFDMRSSLFRAQLKRSRKEFAGTRGILSFSKTWSNPLLWSHYAEKHTGMALGFDVAGNKAREVRYVQSRLDPAVWLGQNADQSTGDAIVYTKFAGWAYEDEVRMAVRLEERDDDGLCYIDFAQGLVLREIVLGSRCSLTAAEAAELVAKYPDIHFVKARPALKSFRVVPNRRWSP